jgi:microcystin degradation protein MlrC
MRIITGGFCHETSTFTSVKTTWDSYTKERFGYLKDNQVIEKFTNTSTVIGGFIDSAEAHGFELIPTIFANAHPSAPTPRDIFESILGDMIERIEAAGKVDGVLLELHGAMVAEGINDGDGYILSAVRRAVGENTPIAAQLDIHSNVSKTMIEMADVLIGRETYPEIDQVERSRECADVMNRILRGEIRPTMAFHQIPLVWGMNQVTAHSPMKEAIDELHRVEAQPGVICGSIATCYPLSDIPDLGASTYVVTDNDPALAQRYADELAEWIWQRREQWHYPIPSIKEVLPEAHKQNAFPVIFADRNDNTGGGAPGDGTGALQTFIDEGLEDACILYIVDPAAVAECEKAGEGATISLEVGAKSAPAQGKPVMMTVEIVKLSDGVFNYEGPRNRGLEGCMGRSAYIRQGGLHVLLVSEREQPFGIAFPLTMGLDPRKMKYIGIKSAAHFRAGYEPFAGAIYSVSEPSVHDPVGSALEFHNVGRKLYPMDDI